MGGTSDEHSPAVFSLTFLLTLRFLIVDCSIMRIHEQRNDLKDRIDAAQKQIQENLEWMCSAKFNAPDNYVRTWEVIERLQSLRNALQGDR